MLKEPGMRESAGKQTQQWSLKGISFELEVICLFVQLVFHMLN